MRKTVIIVLSIFFLLLAIRAFAWTKDKGADCTRVFASIVNENETLDVEGYVKANGVDVVTKGGTAAPGENVVVEWTPPSGFTGTVQAYIALVKDSQVQDSSTIVSELVCEERETPTPTEEATPSATVTPTETPGPTATPGPGPSATPGPQPTATPAPEKVPQGHFDTSQTGWK